MIITNANIAMATEHHYAEKREVRERLDFWLGAEPGENEGNTNSPPIAPQWSEKVTISPHAFALNLVDAQIKRGELNLDTALDARSRVNLLILQMMFKQVTGHPLQITTTNELKGAEHPLVLQESGSASQAVAAPESAGFGLVYERHERYEESEKLEFKTSGTITTADGRQIDFTSSLSMSRHYYEESSLVIRQGDAIQIDPLVINFDGLGAELSTTRFAFDLDNDGAEDQIATLGSGSGFLALDRNGDGVINNGSELFGPSTGRGFNELAMYDEDNNHFIDENDSIYSKLRIWMLHEDGSSQLVGLGDKRIGAIFLGHVTSPFQLTDANNRSLGEVVHSGIYITEEGSIGAVQEINLTV